MPSISYSVIKPASIRPLVAAGGGQAFRQQAGERRRRASSLQLASPPVATRNGLACLLAECAILTHKFCHRAAISNRRFSYMFAPPSTKSPFVFISVHSWLKLPFPWVKMFLIREQGNG